MFRRKRSADAGMTVHAEMPEIGTDNPRMSRRQRRAAEKAAKREAMEAAKRQEARKQAAAKHKATAKKKGAKKKPQPEEQNKRAITAQATIPYREMGKDGICRVHDRMYSKTIRYLDLNYQLAQPDDKADIFDGWSEFLNYFDYTIHAQLTFSNRHSIAAELENLIKVRPRNVFPPFEIGLIWSMCKMTPSSWLLPQIWQRNSSRNKIWYLSSFVISFLSAEASFLFS